MPDHPQQAPQGTEGGAVAPWYVVHTKPRLETHARDNLDRQHYETWLPMLTSWRRQSGRWVRHTMPMFPRYLFMRTRDHRQSLAPVRSTYGVAALVRLGAEPATVGAGIIDELRLVETDAARASHAQATPFQRGDAVRVVDGPLAGLAGIVTCTELERVAVLISLLGREKEILLERDQLAR